MEVENKKEETENCKQESKLSAMFKSKVFNLAAIVFSVVLTAVAVTVYFICFAREIEGGAYTVVNLYVLCMLLAAPTVKVFLDKCTSPLVKALNITTLILIFLAILVLVVSTFIFAVI